MHGSLADIANTAVLGAPFDTATSWRPGARFGPGPCQAVPRRKTRRAQPLLSQRASVAAASAWAAQTSCLAMRLSRSFLSVSRVSSTNRKRSPEQSYYLVDCGDSKMPFFLGNAVALDVLEADYKTLIDRSPATKASKGAKTIAKDGEFHPRVVMLGGDHT